MNEKANTNIAFHADRELQSRIIAQVEGFAAAGDLIKGTFYANDRACFIGCVAHGSDVGVFEKLTGFPAALTKIGESIFSNLPEGQFETFPVEVMKAPRLGADLSLVPWKFLVYTIERSLLQWGDQTRTACEPALKVLRDKAQGKFVSAAEAEYAAKAAGGNYIASRAAYAVYHASMDEAVDDYCHAEFIAEDAACATYFTSFDERKVQRDKFIELLKAA